MRAVVLANHNIGCRGIEALLKHGFEIVAVITHADDHGDNTCLASVAELAARRELVVFAPEDINHPLWVKKLAALKPDILFSFDYPHLIKPELLKIPPRGCLNLHGSLLPVYRGLCPINWALVHGETETGVTLHHMTPRPDDGDIVAQRRVSVGDDDTVLTLQEKYAAIASELLNDILPKIRSGTAGRTPQDHTKSSCFQEYKPADGEIHWEQTAQQVRNLVRAATRPFAGAFSFIGERKALFWSVKVVPQTAAAKPGTILNISPLVIACGQDAVRVDFGQPERGVYVSGNQLATEMNLRPGMVFGPNAAERIEAARKKHVLILGVNGFIGSALSDRLLQEERYEVHGMDLRSNYIQHLANHPRFHFAEGDISIQRDWIEHHVRKCDIVLPLVAIATPIEYTRNPLGVFKLDFEENLHVIRYCVKYGKRLVFPSTSEVYGMCDESEFDEDNSNLVLGPIRMQRWIYASIKQLLDRVIWAYGQQQGLRFTLFRPFNWIGPKLDSLDSARIGSSRAITQLILNLVQGAPVQLIDGGQQKRCFLDVSEGVECLFRIIEDRRSNCNGQIINIGNPNNEVSIRELAELLVMKFNQHPLRERFPPFAGYVEVDSGAYYGTGYQDVQHRRPSIRNAKRVLDWRPAIGLEQSVERTLDFFLQQAVQSGDYGS